MIVNFNINKFQHELVIIHDSLARRSVTSENISNADTRWINCIRPVRCKHITPTGVVRLWNFANSTANKQREERVLCCLFFKSVCFVKASVRFAILICLFNRRRNTASRIRPRRQVYQKWKSFEFNENFINSVNLVNFVSPVMERVKQVMGIYILFDAAHDSSTSSLHD